MGRDGNRFLNVLRRSRPQVVGVLGLHVLGIGLRYATTITLTRLAGVRDYGAYAFALTASQLLAAPATAGASTASVRFVPGYVSQGRADRALVFIRYARRRVLWASVGLALAAAIGYAVVPGSRPVTIPVFLLAMASVVPQALGLLQADTLRSVGLLFVSQATIAVQYPLLLLALLACAVAGGMKITAGTALLAMLVANAVVPLTQFTAERRWSRSIADCSRDELRNEAAAWRRVSRRLLVAKVSQSVLSSVDVIAIGFVLSVEESGIYNVALRTAALVNLVLVASMTVYGPTISAAISAKRYADAERDVWSCTRAAFLPTVALTGVLAVFAVPAMGLFGSEFRAGASLLQILLIGRLVNSLLGPVGMVLTVSGHERVAAAIYAGAALGAVTLIPLAAWRWGPVGAASASTAIMISWNLVAYRAVWVRLRIRGALVAWFRRPSDGEQVRLTE